MTITRYAIRRISADGTSTTHELVDCGEEFELHVYDGDEGPVVTKLGELPGGFTELLLTSPELVTVGTGFTDISTDGSIDIHTLLGLLVVEDPSAEEPDVDDWLDENGEVRAKLGFDLEDWAFASEQIHQMRTNPDYDVVARWLRIDGERAFVLRGPEFIGVGLADANYEWAIPLVTRNLLDWGFYGESGGPCTFDGGATIGWSGPNIWTFHRWGDFNGDDLLVFRGPEPERMARELAGTIEYLGWTRPYLLAAVGLPGLDEDEREALMSVEDVEGQTVSSSLGSVVDQQVIDLFCTTYDDHREAVEGLRHPESERGKLIYAWVRQLLEGEYQSASWEHIHEAMFDLIGPPAEDQRRPTSEERIRAKLAQMASLINDEE